jgi:hypothetical protein
MPLPAWPVGVPSEANYGWQMSQMFLQPVATEMEGGNQRLRQMPGNNVATISYPLKPLTDTEYNLFDAFMRTTLTNGASKFTMPLLIGTSTVTKTVQLDQGKSPAVTRQGGYTFVTLPLRVFGM